MSRRAGRFALGAVVFLFFFNRFGCSAHRAGSASMEPSLRPAGPGGHGDVVLVNRLVYGPRLPGTRRHLPSWNRPARGEVVLVEDPRDRSRSLFLRVVGVPGDRVEIRRRVVTVSGRGEIPEDRGRHLRDITFGADVTPFDDCGPVVVLRDSCFLLADNRDVALDSRTFGSVSFDLVIGRAAFVYWPFSRLGRVR